MIKIRVDGRILFKGTVGEWISRPPDEFRNAIQPGATPQPWMKAILIAMAELVTTNQQSGSIRVLTKLPGVKRGWLMEVVQ